jgi:hypothetical protein
LLETLILVVEQEGESAEILKVKLTGLFKAGEKAVDDILDKVMGDMARKALEIR